MVVVKIDADPMNEVEQDCSDWMNLEVMGLVEGRIGLDLPPSY